MKSTQLYSYHKEHAKLTEFAGYSMPLWYTTNTDEHLAVRNNCGIFDVSHMGRFSVKGQAAESFLEGLVPTSVQSQPIGKAFYTLLLNENAGIIDDLIIIKESSTEFLAVVNAANAKVDMEHIRSHLDKDGVSIEDKTEASAMIAVQGPKAQTVLQPLTGLELSQLKKFRAAKANVLGQPCTISRTGYTGEDGFEVIVHQTTNDRQEGAMAVWTKLLESSAPCGLAARDSLRLEAGLPLHGSDIDAETNPYQAELTWVIAADKKGYVGYEALDKTRQSPPDMVRRGAILDRGIPRHGFEVVDLESNTIGMVTSGSFSPILKKGIALCRVKKTSSDLGASVKIKVRDSAEKGNLVQPPFYDESAYGWKRTR